MTFLMLRRLFAIFCLMLAPLVAGAGEAFLTSIEDVPLPPGLTESANGGVVFDSPSGRIVEAAATGALAADQVAKFYAETLPQLGWQDSGKLTFKRDNETLRITVEPGRHSAPLTVRFNLAPNR
jgi:hypothetical protein